MNEWISVQERLPPQDVCVLINFYDGRDKVKMNFVQCGYRIGQQWFEPKDGQEIKEKRGFVTHWMPLPEAPKEKT
jgi:hypothetical protein